MLSPYRVLDLTDEKGLFCGKLLGDLGADVIKIEKPGGDPARQLGPFYHDEIDSEKSLLWFALNTSKRGITLDIEKADGKDIFKRLVKNADFVIESYPPGYIARLGLDYCSLEQINPRLILVSITPFGQTGPYSNYKASDITLWGMGGELYLTGDLDRPPVRISHYSQAYLHASTEAAVGAMVALHYLLMSGEGQQVDVSIQECVTRVSHQFSTIPWDTTGLIAQRGERLWEPSRRMRIWPCKNGYVQWQYWSGSTGERRNRPLIQLMEDKGMSDEFLMAIEWLKFDFRTTSQDLVDKIEEPTRRFFMAYTKEELYEEALKRRIQLCPVNTVADIVHDVQLTARGYWVDLGHPELGTTITYPGAFTHASETPPRVTRRAPLIGEHNYAIYEEELGLSRQELIALKQAAII